MRVIDFFDKGATLHPEEHVIHDGTRGYRWRETRQLTEGIAAALVASGARPDSVVATYTPNHPRGFAAQYGVFRSGAVWLPVNVRNSIHENIAILKMLDAQWLFFHSQFEHELSEVRAAMPHLKALVCLDGPSRHGPSLDEWMVTAGEPSHFHEKGPNDVVALLTTSGTTGKPKAVQLTNLNWETMIASYQIVMPYDVRPVHIVAAPLTHAAGCLVSSLLSLGATNILLPKPDPLSIMEAIERHRATTVFLPPTLIYMMLSHPRVREYDYSSLKYFMYGAAPMSVQKLREATEVFGPVMCQTYGQTEALMVLSFMSVREHMEALSNPAIENRLWSAGKAGPLGLIGIMDDDGRLLATGERGEIVGRGNIVMAGYKDNPAATAEVSGHGWHHTGDIGTIDEDGYLYIVDRKKDMIISGGFNVYPSEVEQVIWTHPAVQDCAVIGIPDDKWGEAVTAVVELKKGAKASEADLIALCKETLGSVKAPKSVVFMKVLPRSSVGKVLKSEIRDAFWSGYRRAI